jgi:hypothetical protein
MKQSVRTVATDSEQNVSQVTTIPVATLTTSAFSVVRNRSSLSLHYSTRLWQAGAKHWSSAPATAMATGIAKRRERGEAERDGAHISRLLL